MIEGLQEAQAAVQRAVAVGQSNGPLEAAVRGATLQAQRYAIAATHIDTGTLRAAHTIEVNGKIGMVYIDPAAINDRTGQYAAVYGPYEHERGGEHAFYERALDDIMGIGRAAEAAIRAQL